MPYIDGYIVAVPAANKDAYRRHAELANALFKEWGATRQVEAWGDEVPDGKITDFKRSVLAQPDEAVVFSWVEYPNMDTRNAANDNMLTDPRAKEIGKDMPFDGKRMIFGGFRPILDEGEPTKSGYIDGCVIPVLMSNKMRFQDAMRKQAELLRQCGATRVVDAWSDDVQVGKLTDFKGAVDAQDDEAVVYAWIEWPSKEARDRGWEKAADDPRMKDMPFDGKRMIFGGFATLIDR